MSRMSCALSGCTNGTIAATAPLVRSPWAINAICRAL
ncbi:hypothetical protein NB689_003215 [Xanthomonas sacchari]|nr:hypothetical protein [Xanthomonas sacchari]